MTKQITEHKRNPYERTFLESVIENQITNDQWDRAKNVNRENDTAFETKTTGTFYNLSPTIISQTMSIVLRSFKQICELRFSK